MTRAPARSRRPRVARHAAGAALGIATLALAATGCAAADPSHALTSPAVAERTVATAGPVTTVTTRGIRVSGPESRAELVHQVAATVPVSLAEVRSVLGDGWNHGVRIEVAASQAALRARTRYPVAMRAVAALTTTDLRSVARSLVLVNPAAWGRLSDRGREAVLAHELTHVATARSTTASTPRWLSEGFADWIAFRRAGIPHRRIAAQLNVQLRSSRWLPQHLPSNRAFRSPGGRPAARAYDEGWLACVAIARHWGPARLADFYRAVGTASAGAAERRRRAVSLASHRVLRVPWSRILRLWRAQLRRVS